MTPTHQYDPQGVEGDELHAYHVGVGLQQAGYQTHHVQACVPHRGVQHARGRPHHMFLTDTQPGLQYQHYLIQKRTNQYI